jgi:predicted transposase YdaD
MFLAYFPPSKQSRKTDFYTVIEQDFAGNHLGAKRKEGRKEGRKKGRKEGR